MKLKNHYRKISLFLLCSFFIMLIISSNSNGVVYLNSCGKNSGWINNTIYVLNFSQIPSTYSENYCFEFESSYHNITLLSNNSLDVKKGLEFILFPNDKNVNLTNFNISNINIIKNTDSIIYFMYLNKGSTYANYDITNSTFNNITIKNGNGHKTSTNYFMYFRSYFDGGGNTITFYNNLFNNIYIDNGLLLYGYFSIVGFSGSTYYNMLKVLNNKFNNIVQTNINQNNLIYVYSSSARSNFHTDVYFQNNNFTNSVFFINNLTNIINFQSYGGYAYFHSSNNKLLSSIVYNYDTTDIDHDNVGETSNQLGGGQGNLLCSEFKVYLKLFGYAFIQDFNTGHYFIQSKDKIIDINDKNLNANSLILNNYNDNSVQFINDVFLLNRQAIILYNNNSLNNKLLNYTDSQYPSELSDTNYDGITNDNYKGLIIVHNNNKINNFIIDKGSFNNNAQLISNYDDTPIYNLIIANNMIQKDDSRTDNETILQLNVNNLLMFNNTINTGGNINSTYKLMNIKGSNNKIYLNAFTSALSTPKSQDLFKTDCNVQLYNNKIDAVYTTNCSGININPLVSYYNPDDNKVYYFKIGNYYEGYSDNCTDNNNDGFCDVPYNFGIYTDNYTLSEYPFNWKNHLFNALYVVDNNAFNITITSPSTTPYIYYLTSQTDIITLAFYHNSNFTDLTCNYILNGNSIYTLNNVNNSVHSINITNIESGNYTFYVECYNEYKYKTSSTYLFEINYTSSSSSEDNNTITNNFTSDYSIPSLITSDPKQTTDNMVGLLSTMSQYSSYGIVVGVLLIVVLSVGFLFSLLRMFL